MHRIWRYVLCMGGDRVAESGRRCCTKVGKDCCSMGECMATAECRRGDTQFKRSLWNSSRIIGGSKGEPERQGGRSSKLTVTRKRAFWGTIKRRASCVRF